MSGGVSIERREAARAPEPGEFWYSICSAHQRPDDDCATCQIGHWHTPTDPDELALMIAVEKLRHD